MWSSHLVGAVVGVACMASAVGAVEVKAGHPRIFLTREEIPALVERCKPGGPVAAEYEAIKRTIDSAVAENRAVNDCYDPMMQLALLGRTLPGERIYDVDRAIDYLASRGDVHMKRLGLMGLSGGGMITICAAALLPRVRVAMPASHFCTYRDGLMSIHHCGCCYVPGIYSFAEMADVAGLIAPRPIVVVTGREDRSKPIKGVRQAFRDLKTIYRAAGAEEHCHLVVGKGGHRFYAEQAWPKMLVELARIR